MISSFQRGAGTTELFLHRLSRLEVSRRSQCFRKGSLTVSVSPPSLVRFRHPATLPSEKKSIWLCKVQLGPGGGPASCRGWMQGLQGGQEASSRPVPQAVSRTDLRTRGLRPDDCPSPMHLAFSLPLSRSLAAWARLPQWGRRDQ